MSAEDEDRYVEVDIGDTRDPIYQVGLCKSGHVHVEFAICEGGTLGLRFVNAEAAYEFAQDILAGYDKATGIA